MTMASFFLICAIMAAAHTRPDCILKTIIAHFYTGFVKTCRATLSATVYFDCSPSISLKIDGRVTWTVACS